VAERTVGLLHPGEMGASVGSVLRSQGLRVVWASEGRSAETRERAEAAGLEDVGSAERVAESEVVFSVVPPHAAVEVARALGPLHGLYVDANAVSPATATEVARLVAAAGARFVDGGLVGPPPRRPRTTRLYLSGVEAAGVAELFAGSALDARVISAEIGQASAVKMAYAAWTKGTAAMRLAIRELARSGGVDEALLEEWDLSLPGLRERHQRAARSAEAKGWRWVGEMEEIAATFEAAGLPGGFHRAAAEVYRTR
jgi:3-hydroxyisobutyrate dehydrogenase-like beta-hydroxyacid dehydrogenase